VPLKVKGLGFGANTRDIKGDSRTSTPGLTFNDRSKFIFC
jgi:hypothetical protein